MKNAGGAMCSIIVWKSTHYTAVQIKIYIVEKHLCNQGTHYEKYMDDFHYTMEVITYNPEIDIFAVNEDEGRCFSSKCAFGIP